MGRTSTYDKTLSENLKKITY